MAAMAPALTDAPAEAHHIRFKLAPPSSTLSPGSVENNSNASNIILSSNGAVKRKPIVSSGEERALDFRGSSKKEEQQQHQESSPPTPLGKLQPLVASYLCSDVTSVPSTKESLKLQGVLIKQTVLKSHAILPNTYFNSRKHQTLEFSGDQIKSIMSVSSTPVSQPQAPVNGLAKKLGKSTAGSERDCPAALAAVNDQQQQQPPPAGILRDAANNSEPPPPSSTNAAPAAGAAVSQLDLTSLDAEVRARSLVNQNRQNEIENRLRRLRKRLQVVQAKQVERHVQQQLGSFLQTTFSKLPSLDSLRQRSPAVLTRKAEAALRRAASETGGDDGLSQFLKSGSVPTELERLSLSGTANLRATESAFDSDVTESSSGGETDIEEEELTKVDIEQRHISLWRRAEGRYAMERASIVSHWNWLQAHISDLEYRIRQQTDIYRQIRVNKVSTEPWVRCAAFIDTPSPMWDTGALKSQDCCSLNKKAGNSTNCISVVLHNLGSQVLLCLNLEAVDSMASPHSPAADGLSWKGCGPARPVNGVISSLHHGQPDSGSPDDSDTEELLNKKQRLTPLSSPPDNTCVAARTRPILSCKKRRLVRPSTVATLNRKVHRSSGARCSCDVNPLCVICGGRAQPCCDFQYESPLLERLSQFDPCVHPILSFSDDVSMNLHFQRVMKSHWQNKPLEKVKPLKKLSLKHKISLSGRLPDSTSKDKHKLTNSLLAAARHSHHKVRPEKIHRQQIDDLLSASKLERTPVCKQERTPVLTPTSYDKSHSRKRQRDHSTERAEPTPKLYMDTGSPCSSSLANLHTPAHSPLMRQLSTSSESSTPFALNSQSASGTPQPVRRRRGESSFDINNIVIPMSVAATTRVEKLQYKEILTPSWREVDICAQPIAEEDDVMEIEDLSDAAFAQLHLKCEDLERSRWTWTASAPAKRRGSRCVGYE
ncbi:KANL1 protein, partial [Amia calva]|nr:KANL1 protein [Amia calva]